jgi:hypothetical protein
MNLIKDVNDGLSIMERRMLDRKQNAMRKHDVRKAQGA